jgi:hypothetical protein
MGGKFVTTSTEKRNNRMGRVLAEVRRIKKMENARSFTASEISKSLNLMNSQAAGRLLMRVDGIERIGKYGTYAFVPGAVIA